MYVNLYKQNLSPVEQSSGLFYDMKVSIQGIRGAFHQQAAEIYFNQNIEIQANSTFTGLIESVKSEIAEYGIIAIENTISGTIHNNLNLIRKSGLNIIGEVYLRIEQNLAVLPGVRIEQLERVESHYMAINQSREFFKAFPHIQLIESEDTAASIKKVAEQKLTKTGAIGSKIAIREYGLEMLHHSIETNKKNFTRFLIISKSVTEETMIDKSSIVLDLPHEKGSLATALNLINKHNINLSKIESFPVIGEPWHYQFYLDLHFSNIENYQALLLELQKMKYPYQILGEYKFGIETYNKINTNNHDTSYSNANG